MSNLIGKTSNQFRLRKAGSDCVNCYSVACKFLCHRFRKTYYACLGGSIVALTIIAALTDYARHVDNSTSLILVNHKLRRVFGYVEDSRKIHPNHLIPVLFAHVYKPVISEDASIIYKNVEVTKLLCDPTHHQIGSIII